MRHPVVGEIELNYQSFEMPGEPGLRFNVFTAEPDTSSPASPAIPRELGSQQPRSRSRYRPRHQRSTGTPMIATTTKQTTMTR
jgi:hypothetical protein